MRLTSRWPSVLIAAVWLLPSPALARQVVRQEVEGIRNLARIVKKEDIGKAVLPKSVKSDTPALTVADVGEVRIGGPLGKRGLTFRESFQSTALIRCQPIDVRAARSRLSLECFAVPSQSVLFALDQSGFSAQLAGLRPTLHALAQFAERTFGILL